MPSWPVGAHGVALLESWARADVRQWVGDCLAVLREWKLRQLLVCEALGWHCLGSHASFFCARPCTGDLPALLQQLRTVHGVKLRDAASLGLPGYVRLNVLPPSSQDALQRALQPALVHWR